MLLAYQAPIPTEQVQQLESYYGETYDRTYQNSWFIHVSTYKSPDIVFESGLDCVIGIKLIVEGERPQNLSDVDIHTTYILLSECEV